jgi:hypothetical protein
LSAGQLAHFALQRQGTFLDHGLGVAVGEKPRIGNAEWNGRGDKVRHATRATIGAGPRARRIGDRVGDKTSNRTVSTDSSTGANAEECDVLCRGRQAGKCCAQPAAKSGSAIELHRLGLPTFHICNQQCQTTAIAPQQ